MERLKSEKKGGRKSILLKSAICLLSLNSVIADAESPLLYTGFAVSPVKM